VLALALLPALSATPASAQPLNWEQALRRARVYAPGAVNAAQSERAARADSAGAGRWPRTNPVVRVGGEYELEFTYDSSYSYAGGIEQQFDLAGVASAQSRRASASVRAARGSAEVATLDALAEAADGFVALDLAQRSVAIWNALAATYDQLVEATTRTEAAGVTPRQQTLLATIERATVATDLGAANSELARARSTLAVLVGVDDATGLVADAPEQLPLPDGRSEEALVAFALTHRPEFPTLRARMDEAQRRGSVATRSLVPAPTLYVGARAERFLIDPGEVRPNAAGQVESSGADHRSIMLAADLSFALPIFDRNQAERARADADVSTSRENLTIEARRVRAEVGAARAAVEATRASYERWISMAAALDEAATLTRRGFESGQVGIVNTLIALERVARGRLVQARSRADYWRARVALARALGDIS
jgi:cobalt-zinc-cadmium efflux system outer membrane protein